MTKKNIFLFSLLFTSLKQTDSTTLPNKNNVAMNLLATEGEEQNSNNNNPHSQQEKKA